MTLGCELSGSRCYKQVKALDDMCYFESWAQGCGCFEQLNIMDDMNDLGSHELKPLDAI